MVPSLQPFRILLGTMMVCLAAGTGGLADQVELEASADGFQKMDIGVLPFTPGEKAGKRRPPSRLDGVLENDLLLSGRFRVTRSQRFDSSFFQSKNIAVYTQGSFSYERDVLRVTCELHDARSQDLVVGKKYRGKEERLREMIHRFCDEIVMVLFGEKGIAQTRIAYVQKRKRGKEIYVMDYDGHLHEAVTRNGSINLFPSWSPNNQRIIYVSYLANRPDIYISNLYSRDRVAFMKGRGLNTSPEWSRIEPKVIFASSESGNTEIYMKHGDGGRAEKLTKHWSIDTSPTWSPNGFEIAFTSDRKGTPQIFLMDEDGANVRRLTYKGKYNDSPAWSPRGDRIAYASLDEKGFNIYTIGVDGENIRQLTNGKGNNECPTWSPDGRHIAFARSRAGKSDIFIVDEEGLEERRITFSGMCSMPCWSNFK